MKPRNGKSKLREYIQEHKLRKRWMKITAVLAVLAVIVTTALMVLPAITLEGSINFEPYITEVTVSTIVDGEWVPLQGEVTSGDPIKVLITYSIPENVVGPNTRSIHYQLPEGIGLENETSGVVTIDNSRAGIYTIGTNGLISITFDESFADNTAFTGDLEFQGKVSFSGGEGENEIVFGGDGETIFVVPKEEESDLTIRKTGYYDPDYKAVGYFIEVSTTAGTDGDITITDTFLAGNISYDMDFASYPFKITDEQGQEVTGYQLTVHDSQPASFTVTGLPALEAGETYTLTYAAIPRMEDMQPDGYLQYSNQAVASDGKDEAQAQANIVVARSMVYKEGSYNAISRMVDWKIFLNEDMRDISGYTLTDTVTCKNKVSGDTYLVSMPDQVTITPYSNGIPVGESQTVSLPYRFTGLTEQEKTYQYLVTYSTPLPEGVPEQTALLFSNLASFGEFEYSAEVTFTMPGEPDYDVEKFFVSSQESNTLINWASLITYPQNTEVDLASLTYIDWIMDIMPQDQTFIESTHYTTANLLNSARITSADEKTPLVYGEDYVVYVAPHSAMEGFENFTQAYAFLSLDFSEITSTFPWYTLEQVHEWGSSNEPIALIRIQFMPSALSKLSGQAILLQYQTKVDTHNLPLDTLLALSNLARIPTDYDYAVVTHTFTEKMNKQASPTGVGNNNDSSSYTDDPLTVSTGENNGTLHYRILINDYSKYTEVNSITVTDILPAGAELKTDTVIIRQHSSGSDDVFDWSTSVPWYLNEVSTQENPDGTTTVTFTIGHIKDFFPYTFGIYYEVSVANDPDWAQLEEKTYINTVTWDGLTDSTTTTVRHTLPLLEKTGEQLTATDEQDNTIYSDSLRYYITINPEGEDLNPYSEDLQLKDQIRFSAGSGVTFLPDSVGVYHYNPAAQDNHFCGEPIGSSSYTVQYDSETGNLTFTLPDRTPCVVIYDFAIDRGTAAGNIEISNQASLIGRDTVSSEADIIIREEQSSATVNKATMTIYKYESGNMAKLLSGARFKLERYGQNGDSYGWTQTSLTAQSENGEFVVGDSGMIVLNFLSENEGGSSLYNTLYRIQETAAPDGYLKSDEIYYFVWMEEGATAESTTAQMLASGAFGSVSPNQVEFVDYSTAHAVYVPNEADRLTVSKKWRTDTGEVLSEPPTDSVLITLYQWTDGQKSEYKTAELTVANGWSYTWTELPKADGNGNPYRYTVEEESVSGFAVSYSQNNEEGIQIGTIEITNTQNGYVLPETGGLGTILFTTVGLLLIGAFGVGYGYMRHRRRKEREAT